MLDIVTTISSWIWGLPMLILLLGGGIILTVSLRFFQFRYFGYIVRQTFGKIIGVGNKDQNESEGTISAFQATTSALASTVGAANIGGVPVALSLGGPGAIFWMWVTMLLGSASKFTEIVLGVKYREKNEEGDWVGGPMYYIDKGLNWKPIALLFSFGLMLELIPSIMVQANSVAGSAKEAFSLSPTVTGVGVAILVGAVVLGGIKRIGKFAEKMVPFMAITYILGCLIIILVNIADMPRVFYLIFKHAFTPMSATGGFAGASFAAIVRWGIARGAYSNESGMGTAPIAHAAATTDHPVRQGFWGVFSVLIDTGTICTMTALVIISSGLWTADIPANQMPAQSFAQTFGQVGSTFITLGLLVFVVTTIITITFYGEKQAEYLFGTKFSKFMRLIYIVSIVIGAIGGLEILWKFLDILLASIIIPNVIAIVALRKEVRDLVDEFFNSEEYYLNDIK
nr:sodium:alanine symporter family protein [Sporohalobacter salinus]